MGAGKIRLKYYMYQAGVPGTKDVNCRCGVVRQFDIPSYLALFLATFGKSFLEEGI
jgi:hypothetical protein